MKLYLIAIVVALIGLWVSSEVQADELCGLRSDGVFSVENWKMEVLEDNQARYTVELLSKDDKAIRSVGGTVEFYAKSNHPLVRFPLRLEKPVPARGRIVLTFRQARSLVPRNLKSGLMVEACVDSIDYVDGSGTIIN